MRDQRRAFLRNLAGSFVLEGKIKTTEVRAKTIRSFVEKAITKGKRQELSTYRQLLRKFPKNAARKIFYELAPKYKHRSGGYTRITKLGPRASDGARMAILEFVA